MKLKFERAPGKEAAAWLLVGLMLLCLLFLRAGHRLLQPEIWAEDATNLQAWESLGMASVLEPVNGYLILVPRLITNLAASLSIYYYPLISAVLAWGVTLFVVLAVSRSPLALKGGALLGVACLLVPTGVEVFGLPLNTFWWTTLLLFVAVFWDKDAEPAVWARAVCVALAALSSPFVVVVLPLFLLRAWVFRGRDAEAIVTAVAATGAAIQMAILWQVGSGEGVALQAGSGAGIRFELETIDLIVRKFFGAYLIGNLRPKAVGIFGLLLFILCAVAAWRHRRSPVVWGLGYLWGVALLVTSLRVDLKTLHQEHAGARYFFFPYILLSWFLLQVFAMEKARWMRSVVAACLILSVVNSTPVLRNTIDPLHYQKRLEECARSPGRHWLYAHYDGHVAHAWGRSVAGEWCAQALKADWLYQLLRKP